MRTNAPPPAFQGGELRCPRAQLLGRLWLVLGAASLCLGCTEEADRPTAPAAAAPTVQVVRPVERQLTRYARFTGWTEAIEEVDVRARVSGYVTDVLFDSGTEVEVGQPLFEIDRRPFDLAVQQAAAELTAAQARLAQTTADFKRAEKLRASNTITQEEYDQRAADRLAAEASVGSVQAQLDQANLDVQYASVISPLAGRISKPAVTRGNLVTASASTLSLVMATIVKVDPIYVRFDVDEATLLRVQQMVQSGEIGPIPDDEAVIEMGLEVHGEEYPLRGRFVFADNRMDSGTGTIPVRAQFDNPKDGRGRRLLLPGMYARVRVPIGEARAAVLVPEAALGSDQGRPFIYLVDAEGVAQRMEVALGQVDEGWQEIKTVQGPQDAAPRPLQTSERVIVGGLLRVRPGQPVEIQKDEASPGGAAREAEPASESEADSTSSPDEEE